MDTECFPNFWLVGFKDRVTGKKAQIWSHSTLKPELDTKRIATIVRNHRIITFNGARYDNPMLALAMSGASPEKLKKANDDIILAQLKFWEFFDKWGVELPEWYDTIDLWDVAPSAPQMASLKKYAGMMHSKRMQEYLKDFNSPVTEEEIPYILQYNENDLDVTNDLDDELTPLQAIREKISVKIGVDVRSKSNAQIGEALIKHRVMKRMGTDKLYRADVESGTFYLDVPEYVKFETPELKRMLERLRLAPFYVKPDGYVKLPEIFGAAKKEEGEDEEHYEGGAEIVIGGLAFKMGIGGLHSQEKSVSYFQTPDQLIIDHDVASYYPRLIEDSGREPENMIGYFKQEYSSMIRERVADKKAGRVDEAETGKIGLNGIFGKTGSPWSIVYAPKMMIQTTVPGQLALLMLIERYTLNGWRVISANTDGIVTLVPRDQYGLFKTVTMDWSLETGLIMEETRYRSYHARDVNNYVAFKLKKGDEVEAKRKGKFAPSGRGVPSSFGLKKTPHVEVCYDAVVAHLETGASIEEHIHECLDIRKFVTVRAVKGGALFGDELIGKVVRFYYSTEITDALFYGSTGNRVPRSDGAQPVMELPDELPRDIDYDYYVREAYAILDEVGMDAKDPTTEGQYGAFYGRLEEQKTVHLVEGSTGIAACGTERKSRRDLWIRYDRLPTEFRYCAKCRREDAL